MVVAMQLDGRAQVAKRKLMTIDDEIDRLRIRRCGWEQILFDFQLAVVGNNRFGCARGN